MMSPVSSSPNPGLELVVVLETNEPLAFALAKGSFEEAGIPFVAQNEIAQLVTDIDPMLRKWVRLQVPRDREAEARELLAPLLQPVAPSE
jgi:hypothetical protein